MTDNSPRSISLLVPQRQNSLYHTKHSCEQQYSIRAHNNRSQLEESLVFDEVTFILKSVMTTEYNALPSNILIYI
jgi:hypothetical protein